MTTVVVTSVLGETRSPDRVYADGSYSCPFCAGAVLDGVACRNPVCDAGESATVEAATERRETRARRERERVERERHFEIQRRYFEQARREQT